MLQAWCGKKEQLSLFPTRLTWAECFRAEMGRTRTAQCVCVCNCLSVVGCSESGKLRSEGTSPGRRDREGKVSLRGSDNWAKMGRLCMGGSGEGHFLRLIFSSSKYKRKQGGLCLPGGTLWTPRPGATDGKPCVRIECSYVVWVFVLWAGLEVS